MIIPLLKGLRLTLARFFSKPITIQYPEEKRTPYPAWRGIHYFQANEKGESLCVACGLCVAACPSKCITLEIGERDDGTRYPRRYEINAIRCIILRFLSGGMSCGCNKAWEKLRICPVKQGSNGARYKGPIIFEGKGLIQMETIIFNGLSFYLLQFWPSFRL